MEFLTFFEVVAAIIYSNIIFEDSIYKYLKQITPIAFGLVFLQKYVLSKFSGIELITVITILIISLLIITKKDLIDCVIQIMVGIVLVMFGEIVGVLIGVAIGAYVSIPQTVIGIIGAFICWFILIIMLKKIPSGKFKILSNRIEEKKLIIGVSTILLLLAVIIKPLYDSNFLTGTIGFKTCAYIIIFFILIYNIYVLMIKEITDKNRLQLENNFKPMLDDYIHKLRASDHEYKNHLNAIHTIVEVCDEDEIKNKLKSYIGEIKTNDSLNELLYLDNTILKAVLYSKISQAEDLGIKVKYNVKSNFKDSAIKDMDLVIILSNLLNNAIEATKDKDNQWIDINIKEESVNSNKKYNINIVNSLESIESINIGEMTKKGYSTKEDKSGYGLYNIKEIVKRVSGNLVIEPMENSISITVSF
ncbi:MAG: GHKL domain-containing protein [Clostridium sp.]